MILTDNGWTNPKKSLLSSVYDFFIPDRILNSHEWEAAPPVTDCFKIVKTALLFALCER